MTNDPKQSDAVGETVGQPIPLDSDGIEAAVESDRKLEPSAQPTDKQESVRKPIVIGVEPKADPKDDDRTPKNTNIRPK